MYSCPYFRINHTKLRQVMPKNVKWGSFTSFMQSNYFTINSGLTDNKIYELFPGHSYCFVNSQLHFNQYCFHLLYQKGQWKKTCRPKMMQDHAEYCVSGMGLHASQSAGTGTSISCIWGRTGTVWPQQNTYIFHPTPKLWLSTPFPPTQNYSGRNHYCLGS